MSLDSHLYTSLTPLKETPSLLQANLTNANLEGALTTGNTSFRGSIITGAGGQGSY